jgi:uncharacterized protein YjbI with pentapeptide repeats
MGDSSGTNGREGGAAAGLRDIPRNELDEILQKHEKWQTSKQKEGTKADLSSANLGGVDLSNKNLRDADLSNADLTDANLDNADLRGARLHGATLVGADLGSVLNLTQEQLAGTDLSHAKLPDSVSHFEALNRITEVTAHVGTVLITTLVACGFSWLSITSVPHVDLIRNTAVSRVPFVDATVDIGRFIWVAPAVLLGVYLYLHLRLLNLWRFVAGLPRVFQDGLDLNAKVNPWLLNAMFQRYCPSEQKRIGAYSWLEFVLCVSIVWVAIPVTLLVFWEKQLVQHDVVRSLYLTAMVPAAILFGFYSFVTARNILAGQEPSHEDHDNPSPEAHRKGLKKRFPGHGWRWAGTVLLLLCFLVFWAIGSLPEQLEQWVLGEPPKFRDQQTRKTETKPDGLLGNVNNAFVRLIDSEVFVDLRGKEVSQKGQGWEDYEKERPQREKEDGKDQSEGNSQQASWVRQPPSKPALLEGRNLRGANAVGAFLAKADLRKADLRKARFYSPDNKTDLEWAHLTDANLQHADLQNCRLRQADLEGANLQGAGLSWADLRKANLSNATLIDVTAINALFLGANLSRVKAEGAVFFNSDFRGAHLDGADLTRADMRGKNLTQAQIDKACCDERTVLPAGLNNNKCRKNKPEKASDGKTGENIETR